MLVSEWILTKVPVWNFTWNDFSAQKWSDAINNPTMNHHETDPYQLILDNS